MQAHGFPEPGSIFEYTPVSLGLLVSFAIFRAILFLPINVDPFHYNIEAVLQSGEVWRIVSSKVCFSETRDLLSCALLMFHFRSIERRLGSGKFVSLILGNFVFTCAVEYCVLHLLHNYLPSLLPSVVPSGPFCVVYPLLQWSFREFPRVSQSSNYPESPLAAPLFLLIIVTVDLMFALPATYFAVGCAALAGALYSDNFLCLRTLLVLPRRLFPARQLDVSTRKIGATIEIQRSMRAEFLEQQLIYNSSIFRNTRNVVAPPENLITQLIEMGFDRENAIQALQSTNNNLQMATNILLNQ